jgi:hypothetical protein
MSSVVAFPFNTTAQTLNQNIKTEILPVEVKNDFVLEPGKQEVEVVPGTSVQKTISLTNRSQNPLTFRFSAEDIKGSDTASESVVLLGDQAGPYSLKDFISFPVDEVTVGFGERVTIPFIISVPLDAEPGGLYGVVIASNAPSKISEMEEGSQTTIVSRLGSIILVKVPGDSRIEGNLEQIKTKTGQRFFFNSVPSSFEILFRNTGNVHLAPYGMITVKNIFNSPVDYLPVDAYFALPDSVRYREISWESPFLLGRYVATIDLHRSYDDIVDQERVVFWVLPLKGIVAGLIVILIVSTIIHMLTSRFEFKRKSSKK